METRYATAYEHSPLPGKRWIRLLQLLPEENSLHIAASLISHDLDGEIVPYTSLSYSWGRDSDGDASLSREILVDDRSFAITENLYDFLVQYRPSRKGLPPPLWIDAVCINQANVDERNTQLTMMAEIYGRASNLIVWLGKEPDHDGATTIDSCKRLASIGGSCLRESDVLNELDPSRSGTSLTPARRAAFCMGKRLSKRTVGKAPLLLKEWKDGIAARMVRFGLTRTMRDLSSASSLSDDVQRVASLTRRRYFSRRWVVQEIFHSRPDKITVCFDHSPDCA